MTALIEMSGRKFGRWTVLSRHGNRFWMCVCECGAQKPVDGCALRSGATTSCGCGRKDLMTRHGHNAKPGGVRIRSSAYSRWSAMIQRCTNPKHRQFADYGGRGISVCDEWKDFAVFLRDMGEPPQGMTLDRVDNERGYEPGNCRWATRSEQQMNRRTNKRIAFNGETKPLMQWSRDLGIAYVALRSRIRSGWSVEKALSTPSTR